MKFDQRTGTILSVVMHLALLGACALIFRNPLTTQIVAAGEGQATGEGAIEVGVVEASRLGLTQARPISVLGEADEAVNNEMVETEAPRPASDAEVLPSMTKPTPRPQEKVAKTDRPTANQTEQLVTPKPMQGRSTSTSVEVGRSFGTQVPSLSGGVGVGAGANSGAGGVPGGSEYGRRIQLILSRSYNPPAAADAGGMQYVVVQLRIARDGRILSLVNGRLSPAYIKRRSANDLVNYAAERAVIASNPLPPFPNGFLMGAQEAVAEIWFRYPK
ncbi:MAG: TonB C-terminal domain-containing protein [Blastocatellia bacterium]|nr:TonB C-terminal domain-containing protein [Blastocatellia bacterium]